MSFQAYLDNVETKTGQSADALRAQAIAKGLADEMGVAPSARSSQIVDWLKSEYALGHGHAMAIVAYIKGKRE